MLRINNITKTYGDKVAVDNITLHIPAGCIYGLIGHNGAGKSSLLKMVVGILQPDENIRTNDIVPNGTSMLVRRQG